MVAGLFIDASASVGATRLPIRQLFTHGAISAADIALVGAALFRASGLQPAAGQGTTKCVVPRLEWASCRPLRPDLGGLRPLRS